VEGEKMKKFIFIVIMLVATASLFGETGDPNDPLELAKTILAKSEEFYQDFQQKYSALRNYDRSKRSKEKLKEMVDMINRYKRLVEEKIVEIEGIEKTGKPVPVAEFDQLKGLIDRYHAMTVDLANWINTNK